MQQTSTPASRKSLWWWAYFALAVVVYAASIFMQWHRVPDGHVVTFRWVKGDELLALFYGIGLLGLLGYLRGIAVWRRWFWAGYTCLTYAGAAVGFGLTLLQAAHSDALFLISLLLAATAFAIPLWVALWRYAFRSPDVWGGISTAA
jgi:hypothetical protein